MRPLTSVIVPSYNHAGYVERAIRSGLEQDVDLELIVIDDASTDGTQDLLRSLAPDPRLRLEFHDENWGISSVFNHGLELARGHYVAYLCSDDYWLPGHLQPKVEQLEATGAAMVYGRAMLVDEDDRDITDRSELFRAVPGDRVFDELLTGENFIPFISAVFRRSVALAVGGFDDRLAILQDYDLWLRLSAHHSVDFRDDRQVAFRWDGRNASRPSADNELRYRRDLVIVLAKAIENLAARAPDGQLSRRVRRRLARNWDRISRSALSVEERREASISAIRSGPWRARRWIRLAGSIARERRSRRLGGRASPRPQPARSGPEAGPGRGR